MKKKSNRNGMVKNSNQHSNKSTTVKLIPFELLHEYSVENQYRFNRNVYTEKLLELFPLIKSTTLVINKLMEHNHFRGKLTELHYRCLISIPYDGSIGFQDLSVEQWESL